jgi:FMN-dependent NADH-azoreductase
MRILHIDSSINGDVSASRTVSAAVVARLREGDPQAEVTYRDLAAAPLAHLTLDEYANLPGNEILREFQAADVVVIGAGLYNFTIPSQLKAWIDRILAAGETFRYTEAGPQGLAGDKRVIVAFARGAVYAGGSPFAAFEHGESLLRAVFGFIGVAPEFIIAEGLKLGEDERRASIGAAIAQAQGLRLAALAD